MSKIKYDEDTGKPYEVICCNDYEFEGRTGITITIPLMYYIDIYKE